MNVITHDAAYSLYPYATFQQRRSLICGGNGRKQDKARNKYRQRGWKLESYVDSREMVNPRSDFSWRRRWVGDGRCWTVPLRPQAEGDRITSNSWNIRHWGDDTRMAFTLVKSPKLRFQYICEGDEVRWVFRGALEITAYVCCCG